MILNCEKICETVVSEILMSCPNQFFELCARSDIDVRVLEPILSNIGISSDVLDRYVY